MSADQRDELDWLAFRYVAGEMTADEAGDFELRLADDQAAREAVSRAVGFGQRLVDAGSVRPDSRSTARTATAPVNRGTLTFRSRVVRAAGWMAAGAAAATLAVCLARPFGSGPIEPPGGETRKVAEVAPVARPEPVADAEAWARLHATGEWRTHTESWLAEPKAAITNVVPDFRESPTVPPWILAATASTGKGDRP